jgi:hypothetical protein
MQSKRHKKMTETKKAARPFLAFLNIQLWKSCFEFLPFEDVCSCESVSKGWQLPKESQRHLWQNLLESCFWISNSLINENPKEACRKKVQTERNWRRGQYVNHTSELHGFQFQKILACGLLDDQKVIVQSLDKLSIIDLSTGQILQNQDTIRPINNFYVPFQGAPQGADQSFLGLFRNCEIQRWKVFPRLEHQASFASFSAKTECETVLDIFTNGHRTIVQHLLQFSVWNQDFKEVSIIPYPSDCCSVNYLHARVDWNRNMLCLIDDNGDIFSLSLGDTSKGWKPEDENPDDLIYGIQVADDGKESFVGRPLRNKTYHFQKDPNLRLFQRLIIETQEKVGLCVGVFTICCGKSQKYSQHTIPLLESCPQPSKCLDKARHLFVLCFETRIYIYIGNPQRMPTLASIFGLPVTADWTTLQVTPSQIVFFSTSSEISTMLLHRFLF